MVLQSGIGFLRTLYNSTLRSRLPYKISVHNGVPVKGEARLLDLTEEFPDYEAALIAGVRDNVRAGDSVVIVGGGLGVSTVVAVNATGRRGTVETYEASEAQFEQIGETVRLNKVAENVELNHAIVGEYLDYNSEQYGGEGSADTVEPAELPKSDVLVLDCEGAEIEILEQLSYEPRVIIVETHAFLGAPEEEVREILDERNYDIISRGVESASKGVFVISAVLGE